MADPKLLASLDLMRRMPPSRMESSLEGVPLPRKLIFQGHGLQACTLTLACLHVQSLSI